MNKSESERAERGGYLYQASKNKERIKDYIHLLGELGKSGWSLTT